MQESLLEQIAKQLHREYRAAFKALCMSPGATSRHDHGWEHCRAKKYFLRRAERFIAVLGLLEKEESTDRWLQARGLLQRVVSGYCALDRTHRATIASLKETIAMQQRMLEDATAAGITFDYNPETSRMDARNKLVANKPTRIIKLPNAVFCTMKITKIDGKALATPISVTPESVPDAIGYASNDWRGPRNMNGNWCSNCSEPDCTGCADKMG